MKAISKDLSEDTKILEAITTDFVKIKIKYDLDFLATKSQHFKKVFDTHSERLLMSCSKNKKQEPSSYIEPRTPLKNLVLYSQHSAGQAETVLNDYYRDLVTLTFKA